MTKLVFRLNDVPEDEAQAIRDLLASHDISFYETTSGKWGFSVAAIWLKNDEDKQRARELIENYQAERYRLMQQMHKRLRDEGKLETFTSRLLRYPLQVTVFIILIVIVLYLTLFPFFSI